MIEEIYKVVREIPNGKVTTYGRLAKFLKIRSPRYVGKILHNNPNCNLTPCHRVVFADGKLSHSYAFGGIKKQKEKLKKEGVFFKKNNVDLTKSLFDKI